VLDVNDGEDRETFELPGADLSGEKRTVRVFPASRRVQLFELFPGEPLALLPRCGGHVAVGVATRELAVYFRPVNAIAHKRD
jgi:hypothetical protein